MKTRRKNRNMRVMLIASPVDGSAPVSLSQAMALKKRGFSWPCSAYYRLPEGKLCTGTPHDHNHAPRRESFAALALKKSGEAATERVSAPTIRRACIWYDGRLNPEYESKYTSELERVSTWRLDHLQALYGGVKEKKEVLV
jgi:hypothetical protein